MVYRMQLTYDEVINTLELKYILSKRKGYSPQLGIYQISDLNKTLEYISPANLRKTFTIDDFRLKSKLNSFQTLIFTEKSFFTQH